MLSLLFFPSRSALEAGGYSLPRHPRFSLSLSLGIASYSFPFTAGAANGIGPVGEKIGRLRFFMGDGVGVHPWLGETNLISAPFFIGNAFGAGPSGWYSMICGPAPTAPLLRPRGVAVGGGELAGRGTSLGSGVVTVVLAVAAATCPDLAPCPDSRGLLLGGLGWAGDVEVDLALTGVVGLLFVELLGMLVAYF